MAGLAIYNGVILDVHFPHALYRKMLGIHMTLDDLKEVMPVIGQSMQAILDYDGDDAEVSTRLVGPRSTLLRLPPSHLARSGLHVLQWCRYSLAVLTPCASMCGTQDVFCLTFTATYEQFGDEVEVPLVPGGADKPVTSKNREEYVEK